MREFLQRGAGEAAQGLFERGELACRALVRGGAQETGENAEKDRLLSTWKRIGKYETGWAMEAAGVKGNDVETYVKVTQLTGSFAQGYCKYDFDLTHQNHAVLTGHYPASARSFSSFCALPLGGRGSLALAYGRWLAARGRALRPRSRIGDCLPAM